VPEEAAQAAAAEALAASDPDEVSDALRRVVSEFIDVRLLDPHSALPRRGGPR
jgi:hypothetical protein